MSLGKSTRRSLRASVPRFVQPLEVRDEDQLRVLECRVDGYPRPDVRWERSGTPVGKSRRVHMIRTGDRCLLQIKMPHSEEDEGLYSCTATNIVGTATTQAKVSGTCAIIENMNGNSIHSLTAPKLRSRIIAKSAETVSETMSPHRNVFRMRSQSGTRKSKEDAAAPTVQSKTKFATFTSHIWRKNEVHDDPQTQPVVVHREEATIELRKKQLSKSVEDCRKNKRGFLNRVKIPDIFSAQKVDATPQVATTNDMTNGDCHTNGGIKIQNTDPVISSPAMENGEHSNGVVDSRDQNGEVEVPVQLSTRERIAAYLKRFENPSVSNKAKGHQVEPEKTSRRPSETPKKIILDSKTPDRTADESTFFSFAKFRRRKSSDNCKKNGVHHDPECPTKPQMNGDGGTVESSSCEFITEKNRSDCEIPLTSTFVTHDVNNITPDRDLPCPIKNESDASFNDEAVDSVSETQKLSDCSTDDIDMGTYQCIEINLLDSFKDFKQTPEVTEETNTNDENSTESKTLLTGSCPENTEESFTESKENIVPIIHIELSPADDDLELEVTAKEEEDIVPSYEIPEQKRERDTSDLIFKKAHRGKIKYSSPLIEEECEALLGDESAQNAATLEPDLQRVSTPVESPARIVKGPQSVTVLRGESVTLAISFNGHPNPIVIWMKGGRTLTGNGRLSILEGREMSVVTVNDVTADDSGKYVVSVENEGGGDSCFASVAVVGFPEPPGGEPTANEVTDHSLVLSWYGSMYDGGSVVTGYQVEMCTLPDKKYYKVASSVNTSCAVLGLSKGQRYVFRVRAENRYGSSHPSKESKIIKLDDFLQDDSSADEEAGYELASPVEVENGTNFTERFDLKEEVGKGRFGTVYRCVEKSCGRPRAAKVIRCLKVKDKEKVRQEIEIMSRLHHPKLMQVLAAFESGRNMIMVMEFISGGELFERVIADDFVLTEQDCILFMRQICDGVTYMHKNNIIHLDLKPENILCKTRSSHKIKIIDFGLARVYKADESLRVLFGTPEFVAPEVINYEPVCPGSDMWSLGVICYVLLSGLSPFMGDSDTETFANITRGEMDFDDDAFDEISEDAKDFISRLLVKNVKSRLSADECLQHPWLATAGRVQKRPLSTEKLKRFIIRRKWQKSGTAIRALGRMVSLSRSSLGSSCDSYSPLGSPTSSRSRSRSSLLSRSETTESGESDVFPDFAR